MAPHGAAPDLVDALTAQMVALAGPALAGESLYAERIAARRRRRALDRDRNTVAIDQVDYIPLMDGVAERHVSYRRDSGRRWRQRIRYVLRDGDGRRRVAVGPCLVERLFDGRPVPEPKR